MKGIDVFQTRDLISEIDKADSRIGGDAGGKAAIHFLDGNGHGIGPDGAAGPFHPACRQNAEHDGVRPRGAAAGGHFHEVVQARGGNFFVSVWHQGNPFQVINASLDHDDSGIASG